MKLDQLQFPVSVAHRGVKELYPENTLISFQAALDAKAQMIEFDVALSRDRKLVVIHDETLDRTTNGNGNINTLDLADLKTLDAGSWFHSEFNGEKIPTLQEVLTLIGDSAVVNIEIKKEYFEEDDPADAIDKQVYQSIQDFNLQDSVIVSSFEIRFLERLRKLDNRLPLASLTLEPLSENTIEQFKDLGVYSWNPWHEILTREQVEQIHQNRIKVFSFTVSDPDLLNKVLKLGVDGMFTDNQPLFDDLLAKMT